MVLIKITDKDASPDSIIPPEDALRAQLHKLVQHFERLVADETLAGGLWNKTRLRRGGCSARWGWWLWAW